MGPQSELAPEDRLVSWYKRRKPSQSKRIINMHHHNKLRHRLEHSRRCPERPSRQSGMTTIEYIGLVAVLLILAAMAMDAFHKSKKPVAGYGRDTAYPNQVTMPTLSYSPPIYRTDQHKPTEPDVDPATIAPVNNGFNNIDFDGDGVNDYVIMDGNTFLWSKGQKGINPLVPVLHIKGDVIAYSTAVRDGRPIVLFWTRDNHGYFQRCLGTNDKGIPYFGEVEGQ